MDHPSHCPCVEKYRGLLKEAETALSDVLTIPTPVILIAEGAECRGCGARFRFPTGSPARHDLRDFVAFAATHKEC